MDYELEQILLQKKVAKEQLDALNEREKEVLKHISDASYINADARIAESLKSDELKAEKINYIMGNSDGYVSGFRAAISAIVSALANDYRDIRITVDELYVLTDLGSERERAWLKNRKNIDLIEKEGWEYDYFNKVWSPKDAEKEQPEINEVEGEQGEQRNQIDHQT